MNPLDVLEIKHALMGLAEILAFYVDDLVRQGFTRDEALAIAIAWQNTITSAPRSDD